MNNAKWTRLVLLVTTLAVTPLVIFYIGAETSDEAKEGFLNNATYSGSNLNSGEHSILNETTSKLAENDLPKRVHKAPDFEHAKTPLQSDWCNARTELTQADLDFVATEYQEWQVNIGKAYVKSANAVHEDDYNYPNNVYVASYQELPLDELEEQAFKGDKWAMVAYVQRFTMDRKKKQREIASRLLVSGASYHAIEHLVIEELAAAKSVYRNTKSIEKSTDHMINAVTYVMIGLKNYSESGLIAYLGNVLRNELFQGPLNPSKILEGLAGEIRARFDELNQSIEKQRELESISIEEPSQHVQKLFSSDLAIFHHRNADAVKFLHELSITPDVDLSMTPCIKSNIESLSRKLEEKPAA